MGFTTAKFALAGLCLIAGAAGFCPSQEAFAGNVPSIERGVQKLFKSDVEDLDAQWRDFSKVLGALANVELSERALELTRLSPKFNRLAQAARDAKRQPFLHYITAVYATYYGNHERALVEINKAVAAEPNSHRYLAMKGTVVVALGKRAGRDEEIESGIRDIKNALALVGRAPDASAEDSASHDFALAISISSLSRPRWDEVIAHYKRYIDSGANESLAFAWNNLSDAYRHAGKCREALEAADGALRIADFGAARRNRRSAEFCLEMEKLGIITKLPNVRR